jgi:hypothetical protein
MLRRDVERKISKLERLDLEGIHAHSAVVAIRWQAGGEHVEGRILVRIHGSRSK